MPTYEYICDACQHEFEKFQSIKADPVTTCPECGKEHVRRKISGGAAILFKGGGFYETDYRSAGYKESAKKDSEGGAPKTDAKPTETAAPAAKSEPAKTEAPKAEAKPAPAKPADPKPST
ncbi:MAG: putative regulatory protein FmdB family [Phycisphaerales bacterium]|nr:putative regulatory protein FmdB family [Phycisphaerales bacterium]